MRTRTVQRECNPTPWRAREQPGTDRIVRVADGAGLLMREGKAFGRYVVLEGIAPPIEMVGRDVENRGGRRRHRPRPVQLKAAKLDSQRVVGTIDDLDKCGADVTGGCRAVPGRPQYRCEHQ